MGSMTYHVEVSMNFLPLLNAVAEYVGRTTSYDRRRDVLVVHRMGQVVRIEPEKADEG